MAESRNELFYFDGIAGPKSVINNPNPKVQEILQAVLDGDYKRAGLKEKYNSHNPEKTWSLKTGYGSRLLCTAVYDEEEGCVQLFILEELPKHNDYDKALTFQPGGVKQKIETANKNQNYVTIKRKKEETKEETTETKKQKQVSKKKTYEYKSVPIRFINQDFYELNEDQLKILSLVPPVGVLGTAGSGKTLLVFPIIEDTILRSVHDGCEPVIYYVTDTDQLANETQRKYLESLFAARFPGKKVIFISYAELAKKNAKVKIIPMDECIKWIESRIKQEKNNSLFAGCKRFNANDICEEWKIISGFNEAEFDKYKKLGGESQCNFHHDEKDIQEKQRKFIWALYHEYIKPPTPVNAPHASSSPSEPDSPVQSLPAAFAPLPSDLDCTLVIVDEFPRLSNKQLTELCTFAKNKNIYFLGDYLQTKDRREKHSFIQQYIKNDAELKIVKLSRSYRSAPDVIDQGNHTLEAMNLLIGGRGTKSEVAQIKGIDNDKRKGEVKWLEPDDPLVDALKLKTENSPDYAVVIRRSDPELKAAVSKLYKTALVFTPNEIVGLEFKFTIIVDFFDGDDIRASLVDANTKLREKRKKGAKIKENLSKNNEKVDPVFNDFYIAVTRPGQGIYVVQKTINRRDINEIVAVLNPSPIIMPPINKPIFMEEEVLDDDLKYQKWLAMFKTLLDQNKIAEAKNIFNQHLKKSKNETFDSFIEKINAEDEPQDVVKIEEPIQVKEKNESVVEVLVEEDEIAETIIDVSATKKIENAKKKVNDKKVKGKLEKKGNQAQQLKSNDIAEKNKKLPHKKDDNNYRNKKTNYKSEVRNTRKGDEKKKDTEKVKTKMLEKEPAKPQMQEKGQEKQSIQTSNSLTLANPIINPTTQKTIVDKRYLSIMLDNMDKPISESIIITFIQKHKNNLLDLLTKEYLDYKGQFGNFLAHILANPEKKKFFFQCLNKKDNAGNPYIYYFLEKFDNSIVNKKVLNVLLVSLYNDNNADISNLLNVAFQTNRLDIVKTIINTYYLFEGDHDAILMLASDRNYVGIAKAVLLFDDLNPNKIIDGDPPLNRAVLRGNSEIVKILINDPRTNPNLKAADDFTPFRSAINHGNLELVKLLAKCPTVDINVIDDTIGLTPLIKAITLNNVEIVKELLALEKIEVNKHGGFKQTSLNAAAIVGNLEIINLLLNHRDISFHQESHQTPLLAAVLWKHLQALKCLLPVLHDYLNSTVTFNNPDFEKIINKNGLEKTGEKLSLGQRTRWTPLHFAVFLEQEEMVNSLLEYHPPLYIKNCGISVYELAKLTGNSSIIKLIEDKQNNQINYLKDLLAHFNEKNVIDFFHGNDFMELLFCIEIEDNNNKCPLLGHILADTDKTNMFFDCLLYSNDDEGSLIAYTVFKLLAESKRFTSGLIKILSIIDGEALSDLLNNALRDNRDDVITIIVNTHPIFVERSALELIQTATDDGYLGLVQTLLLHKMDELKTMAPKDAHHLFEIARHKGHKEIANLLIDHFKLDLTLLGDNLLESNDTEHPQNQVSESVNKNEEEEGKEEEKEKKEKKKPYNVNKFYQPSPSNSLSTSSSASISNTDTEGSTPLSGSQPDTKIIIKNL